MYYPCIHGVTRYCGICEVVKPASNPLNEVIEFASIYFNDPKMIKVRKIAQKGLTKAEE